MKYIGLDLHVKDFTMCVVNEKGVIMFEGAYATSGQQLVEVVQAVAGPKAVALEETTIADWAYRLLLPHAERVIVADPKHNALIARAENLDDAEAARRLAQLLRGGYLNPVHHGRPDRQEFKRLVLFYHRATRDLTRFKNQLKAKFRQYGIPCPGPSLYDPAQQKQWLTKLDSRSAVFQARLLMSDIAYLERKKKQVKKELARQAKDFPQIAAFQQVPGFGLIRAATFFAVVDTPHRFATKRKLWAYCGLGLARRQSGEETGPAHLNRNGNPLLKGTLKGAVGGALRGHNRFESQYARLLAEHKRPELARLTVARSLLTVLYAMWRKGQPYDPLAKLHQGSSASAVTQMK